MDKSFYIKKYRLRETDCIMDPLINFRLQIFEFIDQYKTILSKISYKKFYSYYELDPLCEYSYVFKNEKVRKDFLTLAKQHNCVSDYKNIL
uniref:Uncharacterized protein n=1 Tax=viral metagenome TaxID=1070528 RepID=A0A6C0J8M0_9ZZZZ